MKFGDFKSFVEYIPNNCVVRVRLVSGVFDEVTTHELEIKDGEVVEQRQIEKGVFGIEGMVGWTVRKLLEWSKWDWCINPSGGYDEIYHEIAIGYKFEPSHEFDSYDFEELEDTELYLVHFSNDRERAMVIPSRTWLGCPLTYAAKGDIRLIQKVKITQQYSPVEK